MSHFENVSSALVDLNSIETDVFSLLPKKYLIIVRCLQSHEPLSDITIHPKGILIAS